MRSCTLHYCKNSLENSFCRRNPRKMAMRYCRGCLVHLATVDLKRQFRLLLLPHEIFREFENSGARGPPQFLKNALRLHGQMKIFHVGSHQLWEALRELLQELRFSYCSSRGIFHSQNGNSYSENGISSSESCSENTLELSESSENGLFTPRAFS